MHTNTIEGFFSIFKRGMKGVYQHCGAQHLHRHLAEFDFGYDYGIGKELAMKRSKEPCQSNKLKAAARRAECDAEEAAFEATLKKLAETKPEPKK